MWHSSSFTDTGQVRSLNEDSVLDLTTQNMWVVADGMGGHSNGDYASQLVTSTLSHYTCSERPGISKQRLVSALDTCNRKLIDKADEDQVDVIGCTVAVLQARNNSIICSWSGDSRIYRLRNAQLLQLTRDHSQESAVEDRDRLRYPTALSNPSQMLTAAIGGDIQLSLEHCWYTLQADDIFLLCTDGLNKEVDDKELGETLNASKDGVEVLSSLVKLYHQRGARDNVGLVWAGNLA